MAYRVLIGINLTPGPFPKGKGGAKQGSKGKGIGATDSGELRFEPGAVVDDFPDGTDVESLLAMGAIEIIESPSTALESAPLPSTAPKTGSAQGAKETGGEG